MRCIQQFKQELPSSLKLRWIRGGERFLQLVYEAAQRKLMHEKILKSKSSRQTPFNDYAMGGGGQIRPLEKIFSFVPTD
jgi:hypothetical protein